MRPSWRAVRCSKIKYFIKMKKIIKFAHNCSKTEKYEKRNAIFWLFKALKLKLCFLHGRGTIFLSEKWLAKSTKGALPRYLWK